MKRICELEWDASEIDECHECRLWSDHVEPHKCICGASLDVK